MVPPGYFLPGAPPPRVAAAPRQVAAPIPPVATPSTVTGAQIRLVPVDRPLPMAGAGVTLHGSGAMVSGHLDAHGSFQTRLQPGIYTADLFGLPAPLLDGHPWSQRFEVFPGALTAVTFVYQAPAPQPRPAAAPRQLERSPGLAPTLFDAPLETGSSPAPPGLPWLTGTRPAPTAASPLPVLPDLPYEALPPGSAYTPPGLANPVVPLAPQHVQSWSGPRGAAPHAPSATLCYAGHLRPSFKLWLAQGQRRDVQAMLAQGRWADLESAYLTEVDPDYPGFFNSWRADIVEARRQGNLAGIVYAYLMTRDQGCFSRWVHQPQRPDLAAMLAQGRLADLVAAHLQEAAG